MSGTIDGAGGLALASPTASGGQIRQDDATGPVVAHNQSTHNPCHEPSPRSRHLNAS